MQYRKLGSSGLKVSPLCLGAMMFGDRTDYATAERIVGSVVPYSPLARGVLTGKYKPGQQPPEDSRAGRKDTRIMQTEFRAESIQIAQQIKEHAEKRGMSAGQFALNGVLNNQLVHSVIAGPRTYEHWIDYIAALEHKLDDSDEALIDALVRPGHPSTPGYSDPRYPFVGRVVRHRAP